jgi:phosphate starvation-inducible membrane PsiE
MEKSNSKTGFFIGLINCIHVAIVFMNRQFIILPAEDKNIIISAWFIITIVLAITGFFLSKKGYSEERNNSGLGIAGMALNGLVILPAILLLIIAIFSGTANKRR